MWTASAHIITAVIGSGVLSLAWSIAQLGWIAGPIAMIIFALVTYYTSSLLADCYRSGDPITGKRNYTYMEVVQANLGKLSSSDPLHFIVAVLSSSQYEFFSEQVGLRSRSAAICSTSTSSVLRLDTPLPHPLA